jgi:hypothetical protein
MVQNIFLEELVGCRYRVIKNPGNSIEYVPKSPGEY